jgi:chromosome segregation ATPase
MPPNSKDDEKKAQMNQIKVKPNHSNIHFNSVAAVADRMVWTGRLPSLNSICEELHVQSTDRINQYFELWKARYSSNGVEKTHIADLSSDLKHLLAEAFEKRVIALKAKLNAECAEIRVGRDRLAKINEQKDAQIQALMLALGDAEVKIADQERRISRLRKEIAVKRDASAKAEQGIGDVRQGLTKAEFKLKKPHPYICGGA